MQHVPFHHACPPETAGFLIKARKFPPSKKKYYFRLNGAALTRHLTKDAPCREKLIVVAAFCKFHSRNGFILSTPTPAAHHVFYARNESECLKWVTALRQATTYRLESFYTPRTVLGVGGFATVRLAHDRATDRKVAVKTLDKSASTDAFLQREINIMRTVHHPNVVRTYDIFESVTNYHIVMEYLHGGSLFDIMKPHRKFEEHFVRRLMRQVLHGLAYLHSNGIAHRDLKPENILLTDQNSTHAKIADFGLSNFYEECSGVLMKTLIGTPQFVAPELVKNEAYGMEVDLWAIGMMIYNMLTGVLPFTEDEVLDRYRTGRFHIEYKPAKWRHISHEAQSLTRMLLCADASRRLNAVGALHHKWFLMDTDEHADDASCASDPKQSADDEFLVSPATTASNDIVLNTPMMSFRRCVHAMRFLKRVMAKAGIVTTFNVEQMIVHRDNVIRPLPSDASVATVDDSEWDFIVQDIDKYGMPRLDSANVSSRASPRSNSERPHTFTMMDTGPGMGVSIDDDDSRLSVNRVPRVRRSKAPVGPVGPSAREMFGRASSMAPRAETVCLGTYEHTGTVAPNGGIPFTTVSSSRTSTTLPPGGMPDMRLRPMQSLQVGIDDDSATGVRRMFSKQVMLKKGMSEQVNNRSPTALHELAAEVASPSDGASAYSPNEREFVPVEHTEGRVKMRDRMRDKTRRWLVGFRSGRKQAKDADL